MALTVEQIAAVCHEANRRYCLALGDTSQALWENAEEWQRQSAINGVGVRLRNLDAPISFQHEAWLEDKKKDGWKYGLVKDPAKKEHPCFLPYDQLPVEQQAKDALFVSIVKALAPFAEKTQSAGA